MDAPLLERIEYTFISIENSALMEAYLSEFDNYFIISSLWHLHAHISCPSAFPLRSSYAQIALASYCLYCTVVVINRSVQMLYWRILPIKRAIGAVLVRDWRDWQRCQSLARIARNLFLTSLLNIQKNTNYINNNEVQ